MPVFEIDPVTDPRWRSLVDSHPAASVFHTPEWLEALRRTYDYKPIVFTTSSNGEPLTSGIVLCHVKSWLTGSKWVSLPFSDHCEPLIRSSADLGVLLSGIRDKAPLRLKFLEVRPLSLELGTGTGWTPRDRYHLHRLDLRPDLKELHARLHKDGVQRKIRRAEREGVAVERGRTEGLLKDFYDLMVSTRRRHGVPPQPLAWFRNLMQHMGPQLTIYAARVNGQPIASVLTLRHRRKVVYKYGCSDERFHNMGGMPRLFWQVIQDAKSDQLEELDLGRSDLSNEGLVRFKDHLGATRTTLQYWQFSKKPVQSSSFASRVLKSSAMRSVLTRLPDPLFRLAGEMLYRHAG